MDAKKKVEEYVRINPAESAKRSLESRMSATEKALRGEKVRYKSECDSGKFKEFLEHRLTIWEGEREKTFHGKNMYEKTKSLIDNWN
jgi:hypothetical protein